VSDRDAEPNPDTTGRDESKSNVLPATVEGRDESRPGIRFVPILITLGTVALAAVLTWGMWDAYMAAPWTRDGVVRVNIVSVAPEVAGRVAELPIADNRFVHKGDLLMAIDPTDYTIAVALAQAVVDQAKADWDNKQVESERRERLTDLATSKEDKQNYASSAATAHAVYQQAIANLDRAQVNLRRTHILSPVNGYVTNLQVQLGDYVNIGQAKIALVDSDSYWVDGYFEETNLSSIHEGDPAAIKLISARQVIHGHVAGVARAIGLANVQLSPLGLASVNPVFTWVRLAQRVPVHINIDQVPNGVRLIAGLTATVQIDPQSKPPVK
jgi:multidrug resistance efflux pump